MESLKESTAIDIKNKLKNNNPMANVILPILASVPLYIISIIPSNIMYEEIASRFKPTINDVIVVAMLLPNIIPILLLKVSNFAFIKPIVSIAVVVRNFECSCS